MKNIEIAFGFFPYERIKIAKLLYEPFSEKVKPIFGSKEKSIEIYSRYLKSDGIIVARKDREILGVAGIKTKKDNWLEIGVLEVLKEFGISIFRVAFLGLALKKSAKNGLLLDVITVVKEARGKGIGTALLSFIIDFAEKERLPMIRLFVIEQNIKARKLYERMGFKIIKFHTLPFPWRKIFGFKGSFEMVYSPSKIGTVHKKTSRVREPRGPLRGHERRR